MTLQTQEQVIADYEDTPIAAIAKLSGKAYGTIKAHRRRTAVRGIGVLTDGQEAILAELAKGMSNKEVALALTIAEKTVKAQKTEIVLRLGRDGYRKRIYRNA